MTTFTTSDGVAIVYDDMGPRDGVPVVLCHGIAAAGEQLRMDAEYFAGLGLRVLVPDLRGHGRSELPRTIDATSLGIARLAQDLIEMLDDARTGPVHWVGNSLGGILALHLLADHEGRFRTLATFGTAYRLSLPRWVGGIVPLGYGMLGGRLIGGLTAMTTTRNRAARPLIAKLVRGFDPRIGCTLVGNLATYDLIANGTTARLPILMLRCGRDSSLNAALGPTLEAMEGRDNFTLAELPEGGHCANLDATDAWRAALIAFWARNGANVSASARPPA